MAVYTVTAFSTGNKPNVKDAIDALKTQLDTVDTGKTIRFVNVIREGANFTGWAIYDT